jgi:hypothetical protein
MNKEYKEYIWSIKGVATLERALNDWFNVFKWDVDISNENLSSLASLSKFTYSVIWGFRCNGNRLKTLEWCPTSVGWTFFCYGNNIISLKQKKWNVFKLGDSIYIGSPKFQDIKILVSIDLSWYYLHSDEKKYYNSFTNFIQSTVKLDKKDITDIDIVFNGKRFKKEYLGL